MRPNVLQHIKPISKKDQVIDTLKSAILSGDLVAGESIVENKIAANLGVGTPLVREALIALEHQGYVQKVPYKGTAVTKLSAPDIEHIFKLRVELESVAIEWAKDNATSADLSELRELTSEMRQAAEEMRVDVFYDKDIAFHRKFWQMSGNPYLVDILERLVVPLFAFFVMRANRDRENYIESAYDHERFIDSLTSLNTSELREIVKDSMSQWKEDMLSRLFP